MDSEYPAVKRSNVREKYQYPVKNIPRYPLLKSLQQTANDIHRQLSRKHVVSFYQFSDYVIALEHCNCLVLSGFMSGK